MTDTIAQAFDASVDYYDDWMRVALPSYDGIFAAALEQIESNRLRDRTQLSSAVAALAVQTEEGFLQTKKDVAQALSHALPESPVPFELENPNNPDERNEK